MRKFGLIFVMVMLAFTFIGCDNGTTSGGGGGVVDPSVRGTFIINVTDPVAHMTTRVVITETTATFYDRYGAERTRRNNVFTDGSRNNAGNLRLFYRTSGGVNHIGAINDNVNPIILHLTSTFGSTTRQYIRQ